MHDALVVEQGVLELERLAALCAGVWSLLPVNSGMCCEGSRSLEGFAANLPIKEQNQNCHGNKIIRKGKCLGSRSCEGLPTNIEQTESESKELYFKMEIELQNFPVPGVLAPSIDSRGGGGVGVPN